MADPLLIDFPATNFTGGSAPTNHVLSISASTLTGDFLLAFLFVDSASTFTTPSGWTLLFSSGDRAAYYKRATTDGADTVNIITGAAHFGTGGVATVRNVLAPNAVTVSSGHNTSFTTPSHTTTQNYTGILLLGAADDTVSQTWSVSPTLTQQTFGYASEFGQFVGYFDLQNTAGASAAYAISKTGGASDGFAYAIFFNPLPLTIVCPTTVAIEGSPYSDSFTAIGGHGGAPFTWEITVGSLPPGLSLNASTGAVTGTPTTSAIWTVRIKVTNSLSVSAFHTCGISVTGGDPPPVGVPVAAYVFSDFDRAYTSSRTSPSAPGLGGWTEPYKIFDFITSGSSAITNFSAGAMTSDLSENRGILGTPTDSSGLLYCIGNGLPDTAHDVQGDDNTMGYWDTTQGAWTFSGTLFAFAYNRVAPEMRMMASADDGVTWSEVDPGGAPSFRVTPMVQRVNNRMYLFSQEKFTNDFVAHYFDMETQLWSSSFAPLTIANFQSFERKSTNSLFVFPNNDLGIIYNTTGNAVVYREWDSNLATWGSPVTIPGEDYANSLMDNGFEIIHAYCYETFGAITSAVKYSRITHGGSVTGPIFTIPATIDGSDGVGHCSIQQGQIFVPRDDFANGTNSVWVADLPAASTYLEELLPLPAEETAGPSCTYMVFPNGYITTVTSTTLTLVKSVFGGTATPADFTLSASGPTSFSGPGPSVSDTVLPGTYNLFESLPPPQYAASAWVCTGGTQIDSDTVIIAEGDTVVCVISNTFTGPTVCIPVAAGAADVEDAPEPADPGDATVRAVQEPLERQGT